MFLYGILVAITIGFTCYMVMTWKQYSKEEAYAAITTFGIIMVFIGGFGIFMILDSYKYDRTHPKPASEYLATEEISEIGERIYSLNAGIENSLNGKFTIGRGYVSGKSEVVYYYYVEKEYGKILESIDAKDTYIEESDEIEPCIKYIYTRTYTQEDAPEGIERVDYKRREATVLVVPKNTIQVEYKTNV